MTATLSDPITCRWCGYSIRRFERRPGATVKSAWDLLRHHIYDYHPAKAECFERFDQTNTFEWGVA